MNLDVQSMSNEISYYGSSVTLRTVTKTAYSAWGDSTETTSDATKTAVVQILRQEDELVKEGDFQAGDIIFWFKGDETNIVRGNRIQYLSNWYEITGLDQHAVGGTTFILEVKTKKI